jgi:hypothetical protein
MAATPDDNHVVALRRGPRSVLIIDTNTNSVAQSVDPGSRPFAVAATREAADPDGIFGYLVRAGSPANAIISAIDLGVGSPTFGVIVGDATLPQPSIGFPAIALTADSNRAYVTSWDLTVPSNVAVVDTGLLLSDPATAVVKQFRVGTSLRALAVALTETQPSASAPVVSGVDLSLVANDTDTSVRITGSGFDVDARVRFGTLDAVAATVLSSTELEAVVPQSAAAQGADIIVTNPNSLWPVSDQHQSGLLSQGLTIASPPVFQPVNQVLVTNFGEGTVAVLNISTDATVAPTSLIGPEPLGLAITPDGERAYVEAFAPAGVDVFNIVTGQGEAEIPLTDNTPGQLDGIAIAPNPATGQPVAYVVSGVFVGPGFDEQLFVIDADSASPTFNTVIDTLSASLSDGLDVRGALAATPDGRFVYANGFIAGVPFDTDARLLIFDVLSRSVTVFSTASLGVSGFQPRIHVTPDGQSLLLFANDGSIKVFDIGVDPLNPTLVTTITGTPPPGLEPLDLAIYQVVGSRLFAFDASRNVVQVFNFDRVTPDFSQLGSFTIPATPGLEAAGLAATPDGALIYAVLGEDDGVAILDTARLIAGDPGALLTKIETGLGPGALAIRPGTPTEPGTNVVVQPIQEVTMSFNNVTTSGETTVTTTNTNPNPTPAGFAVGDPPIFFEIATTAAFTGPIEVCFSYDETQFDGPETDLRILHEEGAVFVDRTSSLDTVDNVICAVVNSFSTVVVGLGSVDFLFDSLVEAINDSVAQAGIRRSLLAKAVAARASHDRGNNETAINQLNALKDEIQAQTDVHISTADADRLLSLADGVISKL